MSAPLPLWLYAVVLIAIGGAVFWGNRPGKDSSQVQSKAESSSPRQYDTKQAVAALQETEKGAADQIGDQQAVQTPLTKLGAFKKH